MNNILDVDWYKTGHVECYPSGISRMTAYLEARGNAEHDAQVFFGLQPILEELAKGITEGDIDEADRYLKREGCPFDADAWRGILSRHLGKIPLKISAIPEGEVVPKGNIVMKVESTDSAAYWLTTWFETKLMRVWYPSTVATRSFYAKRMIKSWLDMTSDDPDQWLNTRLHDFGSRGTSCAEQAAIGGAAHLVNFDGTDTCVAPPWIDRHYPTGGHRRIDKPYGTSIPATEHSTIIAWGQSGEEDAYRRVMQRYAKHGVFACVSDSYDIYNAVNNIWGDKLRDEVKKCGAIVVIRPDSGDPLDVCGALFDMLAGRFGTLTNKKGYKVLNNVRLIQGDGVDTNLIYKILQMYENLGYSAENIAFGMGAGLLQKLNRDTEAYAYKICEISRQDWSWGDKTLHLPVKKTVTSDPSKASKAGDLDLIRGTHGNFVTIDRRLNDTSAPSALIKVFENGKIRARWDFGEIRDRAQGYL